MTTLDFLRELVARTADAASSAPSAPIAPIGPIGTVSSLRAHLASATHEDTVEDATLAGAAAETPGWAFAAGYQAALRRLDPQAASGARLAALCATERGGGHPRAIESALAPRPGGGWTLSGEKTWVTLGADADVLLVVATTGTAASAASGAANGAASGAASGAARRNALRVARVPADRAGITRHREAGPPLPFATDIAHARARFDHVVVDDAELLDGDGYTGVLKPFRTIEDVHVTAAIIGWSVAVARRSGWTAAWIAEAAALLALLRDLNAAPALAPATHVVLAGALSSARRLLESAEWSRASGQTASAWQRDRPLLDVASGVRAARFEAAWRAMLGAAVPR